MVLQHPELVPSTPPTPHIESSEDVDLKRFIELITFLKQRPNYNLPRILGHWRGTQGEAATAELAQLATIELLNDARQRGSYDAQQEYVDAIERLESQLEQNQKRLQIDKLSAKSFSDLSDSEKQQIREHHAQQHRKQD